MPECSSSLYYLQIIILNSSSLTYYPCWVTLVDMISSSVLLFVSLVPDGEIQCNKLITLVCGSFSVTCLVLLKHAYCDFMHGISALLLRWQTSNNSLKTWQKIVHCGFQTTCWCQRRDCAVARLDNNMVCLCALGIIRFTTKHSVVIRTHISYPYFGSKYTHC